MIQVRMLHKKSTMFFWKEKGEGMEKMSKTVDEEMQKLWKQATPEQKYIIVGFMRNIVKTE